MDMVCHGFFCSGHRIPSWDGAERYPGSLEIVAVTLGVVVASEGARGSTRECYTPCSPYVCVHTCEASREKVSLLGEFEGFVDVCPGRSEQSQISSTPVLFSDVV